MKKVAVLAVGAVVTVAGTAIAMGEGRFTRIREVLSGYEETPLTLSTGGRGTFTATINRDETEIAYRLSYSGLEGNVTQAHIHLGAQGTSGGISVFLCTNLGNGPAGTQTCPAEGFVEGVITAANVIGPGAQGIAAGEFSELIRAMRAGVTYVNVHSSLYPSGEVRAQIEHTGHDHH